MHITFLELNLETNTNVERINIRNIYMYQYRPNNFALNFEQNAHQDSSYCIHRLACRCR